MTDENRNLLMILSAVNLRIRVRGAVYETLLLDAEYFTVKVLIGTRFLIRHVS